MLSELYIGQMQDTVLLIEMAKLDNFYLCNFASIGLKNLL